MYFSLVQFFKTRNAHDLSNEFFKHLKNIFAPSLAKKTPQADTQAMAKASYRLAVANAEIAYIDGYLDLLIAYAKDVRYIKQ